MRTREIVDSLSRFSGRGAGTDAERRAAVWLTEELLSDRRRRTELETFWCRPNWALAQAWHLALALAGSLLAVSHAKVGAAMILVAVLSVLADGVVGISPGRRLTPERASQNVLSAPAAGGSERDSPPVQVIITANYDTGRLGLVYRSSLRVWATKAARWTGGLGPGWTGWLTVGLLGMLTTALLRAQGIHSAAVSVLQLLLTVAVLIGLALMLELGSSNWAPGAGDNGSGVAVAISLMRALDAAPPANTSVALVLSGAGDAQGIGLRRHLRARRRQCTAVNTIVLGIGPSGAGRPRWLDSDGPLVPMAFFAGLRQLCGQVATTDPGLGFTAVRARGYSPALPARMRTIPAITICALDADGRVPNSHLVTDVPDRLQSDSLDWTLQAALMLVDALDGYLATQSTGPAVSRWLPRGRPSAT